MTVRQTQLNSILNSTPKWIKKILHPYLTQTKIGIALDEISDKLYRCCSDEKRIRPTIEIFEDEMNLEKFIQKFQLTLDETNELAQRLQKKMKNHNSTVFKAFSWGSAVSILLISTTEVLVIKHKSTTHEKTRFDILKISKENKKSPS